MKGLRFRKCLSLFKRSWKSKSKRLFMFTKIEKKWIRLYIKKKQKYSKTEINKLNQLIGPSIKHSPKRTCVIQKQPMIGRDKNNKKEVGIDKNMSLGRNNI